MNKKKKERERELLSVYREHSIMVSCDITCCIVNLLGCIITIFSHCVQHIGREVKTRRCKQYELLLIK